MKLFSRLFIIVGVVAGLYSLLQMFIDYMQNDWGSFTDYLSYILLESDERIIFVASVLLFVIGLIMLNKVKKRGRIFY